MVPSTLHDSKNILWNVSRISLFYCISAVGSFSYVLLQLVSKYVLLSNTEIDMTQILRWIWDATDMNRFN